MGEERAAWEESRADILVGCSLILILPLSLSLSLSCTHSFYYISRFKIKSYLAGVASAIQWISTNLVPARLS